MITTLHKGIAYSRAPKATFRILHPKEAAQLKVLPYDLRYGYAPRLAAIVAAGVALPLGILIGRELERRVRRRQARQRSPRVGGRARVPQPADVRIAGQVPPSGTHAAPEEI